MNTPTIAIRDFGNAENLTLITRILDNLSAPFVVFGQTEAWVEKLNQPYDFYVTIFHKPNEEIYQVRDREFKQINSSVMFDAFRVLQRKPNSA